MIRGRTKEPFLQQGSSLQRCVSTLAADDEPPTNKMHRCLYQFPAVAVQVYVVGEEGIVEELALHGIKALGGPADRYKEVDWSSEPKMDIDQDVGRFSTGNLTAAAYESPACQSGPPVRLRSLSVNASLSQCCSLNQYTLFFCM